MTSDTSEILSLLWDIGRRMRDEKKGRNKKFSMLHFQTLRYIRDEKRPFMQDIARHLCVTPPAATLLVEGLVKDKFVARSLDRKDRRAVRLELTKAGDRFIAQGIRERMKKLSRLFSALTPRERASFVAMLKKIKTGSGTK